MDPTNPNQYLPDYAVLQSQQSPSPNLPGLQGYNYPTQELHTPGPSPSTLYPSQILHQTQEPLQLSTHQLQSQQLRPAATRQIHRNRASYSCHGCRRRKIKCDRSHPTCANCLKNDDVCTYNDNSKMNNKQHPRLPTTATEHTIRVASFPEGSPLNSRKKRQRTVTSQSEDESEKAYNSSRPTSLCGSRPRSRNTSVSQSDNISEVSVTVGLQDMALEAHMSKLADAVEKWHHNAYKLGVSTSGQSGMPNTLTQQLAQIRQQQEQLHQLMRRNSSQDLPVSSVSSPTAFEQPRRSASGPLPQASESLRSDFHHISSKLRSLMPSSAGINDLTLGHLSIQDGGRSRYIGNSYWGSLGSEVT